MIRRWIDRSSAKQPRDSKPFRAILVESSVTMCGSRISRQQNCAAAGFDGWRSAGCSGNQFPRRTRRAAGGQDREETSFLNTVSETTPGNFIGKETNNPNHEADRVAHRNEPQNLCELPIAQAPRSGYPGQANPKNKICQKIGSSYGY